MKITRKLTAIIALLLSLLLTFTSCSANLDGVLGDLIDQIPGLSDIFNPTPDPTPDGDDEEQSKGFIISAENGVGTIYFNGTVSEGRFGGTYRDTFATLVTITDVSDGYILSFVNDGKTNYIVIDDASTGGSFTEDKFSATIFEWNDSLSTYVVANDDNNRGFATSPTSQYTDFSCYDAVNASSYNFATFTAKNGATVIQGEGGKRDDNQGGNQGGEQGGEQGGSDVATGIIESPETGVAYKFGMVQGNLQNKVYYLAGGMNGYYMATTESVSDAIDVYLETTDGGYYLYTPSGTSKLYVNFVVSADGEHVNGAYESTASTVYRFDSESKTLIAEVDGADYWLATRNDKTYTTMGPCKVSYEGFYGQFYAQGGAGSSTGGDTNGGNQGGNQGTTTSSFDLSTIPEPDLTSSSFKGYYVLNNNTPFFTEEEITAAKAKCFTSYSDLDSLGRVGVAVGCICKNTVTSSPRDDIGSIKPTGWVQNSYSCISAGHLYDRSHLLAHSLAGNDTAKNLATGTVYMNQTNMTKFEGIVRDNVKEDSSNKVLYRVTPVFEGNNLLCSGILMEAYSLHDNGDDVLFCVFVYNVQKGVHLDYATGKNWEASSNADYGYGAGFATESGTAEKPSGGTTGGNTTDTNAPVGNFIISASNSGGTMYFAGTITSGRFDTTYDKSKATVVTVSKVSDGYILSFDNNGTTNYIVMDDNSKGGSFTTSASSASVFKWNSELSTYVVAASDNNRAFGCGPTSTYMNFSSYDASQGSTYNWGQFTAVD